MHALAPPTARRPPMTARAIASRNECDQEDRPGGIVPPPDRTDAPVLAGELLDVEGERQPGIAFSEHVGIECSTLFDRRGEATPAFRGFPANAVPSTSLIDPGGRVAAVYTGAVARADLVAASTALLKEGGS